ncbi:hypothetical protein F4809DRAFT_618743 [Biscogniauxia mediterranea]|nr:hypothetical protein F4809DRAFT_618743 [Biscogniauxia mediterranea]
MSPPMPPTSTPMPSLHLLLLLLLSTFACCAAANSVPTFCKCTCFKNSTLIQLGPQTTSSSPGTTTINEAAAAHHSLRSLRDRAASSSCTQCTRAFCLSLNLPICKDAEENDALAMCFQRDSRKDQLIVWGFILGTTGLLGWAATKRVIEIRESKRATTAIAYVPVGRDTAR